MKYELFLETADYSLFDPLRLLQSRMLRILSIIKGLTLQNLVFHTLWYNQSEAVLDIEFSQKFRLRELGGCKLHFCL